MEPLGGYGEISKPLFRKKSTELAPSEDRIDENSSSAHNIEDSCPSDCESGTSRTDNEQRVRFLPTNGLIRISEGEMIHNIIKKKMVFGLTSAGHTAQVECIHRNDFSGVMNRAKLRSFGLYSKAMEIKCDGNSNLKFAWYGASKAEINGVLTYGFSLPMMNNGAYGHGVYLSHVDHPIESLQSAVSDENGLKHMLLCRVILGKSEVISPGSRQYKPTSEEFDSGLVSFEFPKKYIVWASSMNTHILPEFMVSFRTSSTRMEARSIPQSVPRLPRSDWMPFPTLVRVLTKFLPSDAIEAITKHHRDFKKQRISRHDMIQIVRNIAGDNLLAAIVKSYRGKMNSFRDCSIGADRSSCRETM